jgi:hypothetical protein
VVIVELTTAFISGVGSPVHLAVSTKIVVSDGMNSEEMIFFFSGLLGKKKGMRKPSPLTKSQRTNYLAFYKNRIW